VSGDASRSRESPVGAHIVGLAVVMSWVAMLPLSTVPFQGIKAVGLVFWGVIGCGWLLARRPLSTARWAPAAWKVLFLWAVAILIATVASPARHVALWGNDDRWLGGWVWLSVGVLAVVWMASGPRPQWLGDALFIGSWVAVSHMLLARIWPEAWQGLMAPLLPGYEVGGTLGNGAFLGVALAPLPVYFWTLYRLASTPRDRHRWLIAIGWSVVGIVLSNSRASWLGLVVSVWAYGLFYGRSLWRWIWGVGGIALAVGAVTWAATHPYTWAWDMLHRNGTLVQRLIVWQATWQLLRHHPWQAVAGFGADTLGLFFPEVYPPVLIGYEPDLTARVYDRAHLLLLDVWVQFGVVGVVALAVTAWEVLRLGFREGHADPHVRGLFSALAGLGAAWVWHFPTPTTLLLGALWLGTLFAGKRPSSEVLGEKRLSWWGSALAWVLVPWLVFAPATGRWVWGGFLLVTVAMLNVLGTPTPVRPLLVPALLAGGLGVAGILVDEPFFIVLGIFAAGVGMVLWDIRLSLAFTRRGLIRSGGWVGIGVFIVMLVMWPLREDMILQLAQLTAAQGDHARALTYTERLYRWPPRERTAIIVASIYGSQDTPLSREAWLNAQLWLAQAPRPRSAAWWHTALWLADRATQAGLLSATERERLYTAARAYFPGNLAWQK